MLPAFHFINPIFQFPSLGVGSPTPSGPNCSNWSVSPPDVKLFESGTEGLLRSTFNLMEKNGDITAPDLPLYE